MAPPPPAPLSATALSTLRACPAQYAHRHLRDAASPTAALVFGRALHAALAALFRLAPERRHERTAHGLLRDAWRREPRSGAFASRDQEGAYGRLALQCLSRYLSTADAAVRPIGVERWVGATLPGGRRICGRVDRLDAAGDALEVVDYKSGAARGNVADDLAAQVYAVAAQATFDRPVSAVRYVYLAEGTERIWTPTAGDLDDVLERLNQMSALADTGARFDAHPGWACRRCPAAEQCPAPFVNGVGSGVVAAA